MESINANRGQFVKVARAHAPGGEGERWACEQVSPTLNTFDNGDSRSVVLITRRPLVRCFDNSTLERNPADCGNVNPTLQARLGTDGGNVPIVVNGTTSYGINTNMFPFSRELSQVLSEMHLSGIEVYGIKSNQSEKSRKPWSKDVAQCLSASCHDASVVMIRKKNADEK